jgi:hypothetical protein
VSDILLAVAVVLIGVSLVGHLSWHLWVRR